ncbi:MAG: hypothetical protein J5748_03750 [Bacteroidales bacterium]|nr:hypothetical protein [Bacteroidales bacterium]
MENKYAQKFIEYLNNEFNPETFYRELAHRFGQYGTSKGRPYSEIYAQIILEYNVIEKLNDIECVSRKDGYNPQSHTEVTVNKETNQIEKTFAKSLLNKTFDGFGHMMGFEIPLQDIRTDVGGDIDLFSYDPQSNNAYILEFKRPKATDTLLRCALEAYTYYKRVNHTGLLKSFNLTEENPTIIPAVLVFNTCQAAKEYYDLDNRPFLKQVLEQMNVRTFIIDISIIPEEYRILFK